MIKPRDPLLKLQLTHRPQSRQVWCLYVCGNPIQLSENYLDFKFRIYILIFIPSRRPQANSEPIVFKMYPFLSEIACTDSWLLLMERCNVVCGEVQFSRGCWWRGAIFLMLVVGREPPQFRPQAREAPLVLVPLVPPHNVDVEVSKPPRDVATNLAW